MIKTSNINFKKFEKIDEFMKLRLFLRGRGMYLAGGALQTLVNPSIEVNDYDLFFSDISQANITKVLLEEVHGAKKIFECPAGDLTSYKLNDMKIQLITKFSYSDMETLIGSFDFKASMFAYDGKTLVTTRDAIKDTKKRQIRLNGVYFPVATLNRMIKYAVKKKFHITPEAIIDFVKTVNTSQYDDDQMDLYID